jgi:hypothetical protein
VEAAIDMVAVGPARSNRTVTFPGVSATSLTPLTTDEVKPAFDTVTVQVPAASPGTENAPALSVTARWGAPLALLVTCTDAPATALPAESLTTPVNEVGVPWAEANAPAQTARASASPTLRELPLMNDSLLAGNPPRPGDHYSISPT